MSRVRRIVVSVAVVLALAGLITVAGCPGPGAWRRYPAGDLYALADRIDHLPPPRVDGDPCFALRWEAMRVEVDLVRSRVVVVPVQGVEQALLDRLTPAEHERVVVDTNRFGVVSCTMG